MYVETFKRVEIHTDQTTGKFYWVEPVYDVESEEFFDTLAACRQEIADLFPTGGYRVNEEGEVE